MIKIIDKIQSGCLAALATVLIINPVVADDIEIYESSLTGEAQPNVLFVLDTSGSMFNSKNDIKNVHKFYDPSSSYTSACATQFDENKMYAALATNVSCENASGGFPVTQNKCARLTAAISKTGFYRANYAQWDSVNAFWGNLTETTNPNNYIECEPDQGTHGDGSNNGQVNINITGSGNAYTSSSVGQATSWSSIESQSLILFSGKWMNYKTETLTGNTATYSRDAVMKNVLNTLLYTLDGVNVGLMNYNQTEGGRVRYPMSDIRANRELMVDEIGTWVRESNTPLTETLYEAYQYYSGGSVVYGDVDGGSPVDVAKVSVPASRLASPNNDTYKTPINPDVVACQKNFIIYLSDGDPSRDTSAAGDIATLTGATCDPDTNGACLSELAGYMNKIGDVGGITVTYPDGSTTSGVEINTYTVGFGQTVASLQAAALAGGGAYNTATNPDALLKVLLGYTGSISEIDSTFSSPAVSVNAFTRTTHLDDLYFTLFKPRAYSHWDGNLKHFKLHFETNGNPRIDGLDSAGVDKPAINAVTGAFNDDVYSYWTDLGGAPDGNNTSLGGGASKLTVSNKVYTHLSTSSNVLSANDNLVRDTNTLLETALGKPANPTNAETTYYDNLINWLRGADAFDDNVNSNVTEARKIMGDVLHSQLALIQYDNATIVNGVQTVPADLTAYVATNDGKLHAFSTATGEEEFSFIPPELLSDMSALQSNASPDKYYGLDGTVVPYIVDNNRNGVIEPGGLENDKAYIFFGMRRGGNNYYGLDVTNKNAPKLMWTIKGGVDADFMGLGQTWSKPTVRIMKIGTADVPVLIFAGGYDITQDSVSRRTPDTVGKGIYIVDAVSASGGGNLLWRMGPDTGANIQNFNMNYSMPSDVSAVDTNGDGYVDHIYVGDMGGQLWRVDIDKNISSTLTPATISSAITGGRIADFAGNTPIDNRRFYYPPAVSIGRNIDGSLYTALVISSGYRAHPKSRGVQDKIFMLRDTPVNGKPGTGLESDYVTKTVTDLYDATANIIGQGADAAIRSSANDSLQAADGWFIDLAIGTAEKALGRALVFDNDIFLTTYEPQAANTTPLNACTPPDVGTGYLYHMNLGDATPVKNYFTLVTDTTLTADDRRQKKSKSGIPGDPSIITTEKGSANCVGTECEKLDTSGRHKIIYWYEK